MEFLFDTENNQLSPLQNLEEIHDYVSILSNYSTLQDADWKYKPNEIDLTTDYIARMADSDLSNILQEYVKSYKQHQGLPKKLSRISQKMSLWNAFVNVDYERTTMRPYESKPTTAVVEPTTAAVEPTTAVVQAAVEPTTAVVEPTTAGVQAAVDAEELEAPESSILHKDYHPPPPDTDEDTDDDI